MLNTDSPRWAELEHAFGNASEVPRQLHQLFEKQNYGNDPHEVLFGCLCHQGSIYTATYAAVPHVVNAFSTQSTNSKIWLFTFLGLVAISKDTQPIPDDLRMAYFKAMNEAKFLVIDVAKQTDIPKPDYAHLLSAVPALHGLHTVHEIIDWMLVANEVRGRCVACGEEFSVDSEKVPFKVEYVRQHSTLSSRHKVEHLDNNGITVMAQSPHMEVYPTSASSLFWNGSVCEKNVMSWLISLATSADHPAVVERVLALFGHLDCINCKTKISLWDAARLEKT